MRSRRLTAAVLGAAVLGMSIGFVSGTVAPGPTVADFGQPTRTGPGSSAAGSARPAGIGPG
ncbi:hypothetical protein [Streptosporangium pseudovulgare]|uniref:Uncharacterized protein n=1 Tax=Streptosporangium pseudovulgare TaxID=35765 RepID=A0ABQ2R134_9ACTN|nr:hypothetical protein [Streptosporangium pseudovulgare]GGQ07232.1 hypothetical protein GCM10010140_41820 [Streptosporangium pseudovulgare]